MNGYHGRFLDVDLGAGTTKDLPLSEEDLKKYIGGATLAAALVYDRVSEDLDPLSPREPPGVLHGAFHRLSHSHGEPICGLRGFATDRVLG